MVCVLVCALVHVWLLCAEDPLELHLNFIKANAKPIQSIYCVILYALCLIVSMPYGLSSLLWLVGPKPQVDL